MAEDRFTGPIFLVGMPRSGTKLLRELLNGNPMIGIPRMESAFIPFMIDQFGDPPNFDDDQEFQRFVAVFSSSFFYQDFLRQEKLVMPKDELEKVPDRTSWASLFETILRFYAPEGRAEGYLWGDKSPNYLYHMPLLKRVFPRARFIHIIRDPRDYCLSNRNTWGKSIYRAAESWRRRMAAARKDSHQLNDDYTEVFYESLLDDPEGTLRDICTFLGCEYVASMTAITQPPENLGDAKGELTIVSSNKGKFAAQLSPQKVRRVEEIVYPVARGLGYNLGANRFKPIGLPTLAALTVFDGFASVAFHTKQYGLIPGIRRVFSAHSQRLRYAMHTHEPPTDVDHRAQ